ncbi:MAG: ABC transporter permease [Sulfolobales archaeon]
MTRRDTLSSMLSNIALYTRSLINPVRMILEDRYGRIGFVIVASIVLLGVLAPYLPLPDYNALAFDRFLPPSREHLLGTDSLGRDLLSRVIWGARVSLLVGFTAAGIAAIIGILLGTLAGYYGGVIDVVISRVIDIFFVIPTFFIALTLAAIYGSNIYLLMLIIGLTTWPTTARIMRAQVYVARELLYVEAARALGAGDRRIILKHIIPVAIPPAIANTILLVGNAIIIEAGLSYLGLGDPNIPSWGRIIYEGQPYIERAWWISIFPGVFLVITVLGLNFLGDSLYRIFTPRIRAYSR